MLTYQQAEALTDKIKTTLIDLEHLIDQAYEGQADVVLGYPDWASYCKNNIPLPQLDRVERNKVIKVIYRDGTGMTQREVAATLHASKSTINRVLRDLPLESHVPLKPPSDVDLPVPNGTPRSFTPRSSNGSKPPKILTEDEWRRAENLVLGGASFTKVAKMLNVTETTIRRNVRIREARESIDPSFDAMGSLRHPEMSIACEVEPATELINDIKRQLARVLSPVYTLSKVDQRKLADVLRDGLKKLEQE